MPIRALQTPALCTVILFLVVGIGGAEGQPEPLEGSVVNTAESAVKDARVVLREPGGDTFIEEHTTDEDGRFTLRMEHLRPGLELHFSKPGYEDLVVPVGPQHLVMATVEVVMQPIPLAAPPRPTATPLPTLATAELREKAILTFNQAVELWEESEGLSQKQDALRMVRQAASLDPDFVEPLIMLSRYAMKSQKWAEASRYSEAWLRIDPNSLEAAGNVYYCMVIMRHHLRIGDAIRRLVALDETSIDLVTEHAEAYYTGRNYLMAKAIYETLTDLLVDPTGAYLNLGTCCIQLEDVECTRSAFENFLEIAPEDHPHRETVENDLAILNAGETPE
ncbi:MAG: hypothetical protein V2I67_18780 [Thermoanaerobaculales bacterium]|jgi:cytochrome c-type biogenesis protein CcmH/NrfG|nr:hypothetical protein [Thermoanaerobaculales bacterium]